MENNQPFEVFKSNRNSHWHILRLTEFWVPACLTNGTEGCTAVKGQLFPAKKEHRDPLLAALLQNPIVTSYIQTSYLNFFTSITFMYAQLLF